MNGLDFLALLTLGFSLSVAVAFIFLAGKAEIKEFLDWLCSLLIIVVIIAFVVGFIALIGWSIDRITCGGYCNPLRYFGII